MNQYDNLSTGELIAKFKKEKKKIKKYRTKINKNINQILSHNFPQGKYKIIWEKPKGGNCLGLCSDPKDRRIWIDPSINDDLEILRVVVDESIHASVWALDNDFVGEMSDSISELLYKIGFRLKKDE